MIKRERTISISPTPEEIASEFCGMDGDEQARFFNEVANLSDKWPKPLCFQMQNITDSDLLNNGGRGVMSTIGEYSTLDPT